MTVRAIALLGGALIWLVAAGCSGSSSSGGSAGADGAAGRDADGGGAPSDRDGTGADVPGECRPWADLRCSASLTGLQICQEDGSWSATALYCPLGSECVELAPGRVVCEAPCVAGTRRCAEGVWSFVLECGGAGEGFYPLERCEGGCDDGVCLESCEPGDEGPCEAPCGPGKRLCRLDVMRALPGRFAAGSHAHGCVD